MPDLVISRFKENIDWVSEVPTEYDIYLYNKGPSDIPRHVTARINKYFELENIGKESDTYLLHMICKAEEHDSYTVFSQGNPFEHSNNFIELLSQNFSGDVWGYSSQWKIGYPPRKVLDEYFEKYNKLSRNEIYSLFNWSPLYSLDEGAFHISRLYFEKFGLKNGGNIAADFFGRIGYTDRSESASKATFGEFSYGAIFGVRNKVIRAIDKEVYMKALTLIRTVDMAGHVMERLWLHFFGHPFHKFDFE